MVPKILSLDPFHFQMNAMLGVQSGTASVQLQGNLCLLRDSKPEAPQQGDNADLGLHFAKTRANAISGTIAKRQISKWMTGVDRLRLKATGIELLWFRIYIRIVVDVMDRD